jgi:parvulin-like peptidyl-prolyl isomerase
MRFCCTALLLLAPLAFGQAQPPAPTKPAPKPAARAGTAKTSAASSDTSSVPPDAPVITITGVCDSSSGHTGTAHSAGAAATKPSGDACKTIVTRAQFEMMADALSPNMNAATKKQLGTFYPKLLLYAQEAHKRGIDKDPKFQEVMEFKRLQTLAQELVRNTQEQTANVPESDIEKYYKDNGATFEQVTLQRLYIPKEKAVAEPEDKANKSTEKDKKPDTTRSEAAENADAEAMKKEADSLQARAAAGEDFEKLQKEAYTASGLQGTAPSTNIGKLTRAELPANHRAAMDLKPGEVSPIFTEANGYYVYKVVAKDMKPIDQAREQIRTTLAQQKLQDTMQAIEQSGKSELNEAYFAAPAPAATGARPSPHTFPAPPPTAQPTGTPQGKPEASNTPAGTTTSAPKN